MVERQGGSEMGSEVKKEAYHSLAEEVVRLIQSSDGMSNERFNSELSVILRSWSARKIGGGVSDGI